MSDNTSNELMVMNLIVDAGSARSYAMEAIRLAREGNIADARESLKNADDELSKVHGVQTELIQNEARGNHSEVTLFMVHAQDHIMTAMLAKDLASEFIELYEKKLG